MTRRTRQVETGTVPDPTWTPSLADVGSIERTRTKNALGDELGTFTDETRPTDTEVTNLITKAVRDVTTRLGTDLVNCTADDIADLRIRAGNLAAIRTALLIELSYFPEQVGTDVSPYSRLKELWDEDILSLEKDVAAKCGDGDVEGVGGNRPDYDYPAETVDLGRNIPW
jgi:hypothetical protein